GLVGNSPGTAHAAIWSRNSIGQFQLRVIENAISVAEGIVIKTGSAEVVGSYRLADGRTHACLWSIHWGDGNVQRIDLGTAGGQNSEALAAAMGPGGVVVAGRAQRADGTWVAGLMEEEGIFYSFRALPTPVGAQSRARSVSFA